MERYRGLEEQRDFIRMSVSGEVELWRATGVELRGELQDLSASGLSFRTTEPLDNGEILDVCIPGSGASIEPLRAKAEVVRIEAVDGGWVVACAMRAPDA